MINPLVFLVYCTIIFNAFLPISGLLVVTSEVTYAMRSPRNGISLPCLHMDEVVETNWIIIIIYIVEVSSLSRDSCMTNAL